MIVTKKITNQWPSYSCRISQESTSEIDNWSFDLSFAQIIIKLFDKSHQAP